MGRRLPQASDERVAPLVGKTPATVTGWMNAVRAVRAVAAQPRGGPPPAPSAAVPVVVPVVIPEGATYTVPEGQQPYVLPVVVDGTLIIDGWLVEV